MSIEKLPDDCVVRYYENIRTQIHADHKSGGRYGLIGEPVRQYAQRLRDEIDKRRLNCRPIDWHMNLQDNPMGIDSRSTSFDD